MKTLKTYIEELTNLIGNVGYEDDVIDYLMQELKEHHDKIRIDTLGNISLHLTKHQSFEMDTKLVIFAHMDEVGMMIKRIDDHGFLKLEKLGSINAKSLSGTKVIINSEKGKYDGVVGVKSHHLSKDEAGQNQTVQDIYIDLGAKNRQDVLNNGIKIGDPVTIKPQFVELLNNCVSNKSMDDRALIAIMLYLIKNIDVSNINVDTTFVFSVQEEFSIRGIIPMIREIKPDVVIGLDVTPATDTPDLLGFSEIFVGAGPALTFMQHHSRTLAGIVPNRTFVNYIDDVAKSVGIKTQREVATGILTETAYISIDEAGVAVANISLPTRYTHTPVEIVSLDDCLGIYKILEGILYQYNPSIKFGKNYDYYSRLQNK
jgi:putative aminopeptidase FrvX